MFYLVIKSGKHAGKKIPIKPGLDFTIGRDATCQIRLASTDVSRQHCRLRITKNGVRLDDLKSRNGTYLDGFLVQAAVIIRPESTLRVGEMEFQLKSTAPRLPQEPEPDFKEDQISSWLTDDGETDEVNLDDSTVIPGSEVAQELTKTAREELARHPDADEAASIIEQHWKTKFGV